MKRIAIYLFFDKDGIVDRYVEYALSELRKSVETIIVVSNGAIGQAGMDRLNALADGVWLRKNIGFDVWAYKDALDRVGWDALAEYDELILLNYTFFGPIGSFEPMFAEMAGRDLDFWGITAHGEYSPNPLTGHGVMPEHLQSHWIAVRAPLLGHPDFRAYWDTMPPITSYNDSIQFHESRFTKHFADLGYRWAAAFPVADYPSPHPIFDNAELILQAGVPIVKRRTFFHDPLYLDRHAILGGRLLEIVAERGYDLDLIWENLARTTPSRLVQANTGGMSVFDPEGPERALPDSLSVLVIAHVYYTDMTDEILDGVERVPNRALAVLTTSDAQRREELLIRVAQRGIENVEVRVVGTNRGRDVGAFLIDCRDVLLDERFDLVLKLHSKKSAQDEFMVGTYFKDHLIENLVPSRSYASRILGLFVDDGRLGMVFPPVIQTGYPTMGHAWFSNRDGAAELLERMGADVALDTDTPLAPLGSMFLARRDALAPLLALDLQPTDFPDSANYRDGTLAHIIERVYGYLPAAVGMHVRTVMSTARIGRDYTILEYKYQQLAHRLPAWPAEQVRALDEGTAVPPVLAVVKRRIQMRWPRMAHALTPFYGITRSLARRTKRELTAVSSKIRRSR